MANAEPSTTVGVSKIIIPFFDPESKAVTPRAWLSFVEMARKSAGKKTVTEGVGDAAVQREVDVWTSEMTCVNAISLLRGTASKWIKNLLESQANETKDWEVFKASFKKRFVKSLTLTEKLNLTDLRMTASESVLDFYDRCKNNINLFFEEEWESLVVGETKATLPWGSPGTQVTEALQTVSKNYHRQCVNIHLKLAFAAGLRDSIKRQTLIQPTETLDEVLAVAQRVEASQKEVKREVAVIEAGFSDEEEVEVGAINARKGQAAAGRSRFLPSQARSSNNGGATSRRPGGTMGDCYYCLKPNHMKRDCITRRNDRNKGIFRSNINAAPSRRQNASVEMDDSNAEAAAEASAQVQSAQIDIADYLNIHSA